MGKRYLAKVGYSIFDASILTWLKTGLEAVVSVEIIDRQPSRVTYLPRFVFAGPSFEIEIREINDDTSELAFQNPIELTVEGLFSVEMRDTLEVNDIWVNELTRSDPELLPLVSKINGMRYKYFQDVDLSLIEWLSSEDIFGDALPYEIREIGKGSRTNITISEKFEAYKTWKEMDKARTASTFQYATSPRPGQRRIANARNANARGLC